MLKISNLTVKVSDKLVLNNLDLTINDGEIHVIMGKNGIGKSSLCKTIFSDPNYYIVGGTITYNNQKLNDLDTSDIAKKGLMYISQNPTSIEGVTNAEILRAALREKNNQNINIFEFNKAMEEACEKLDLDKSFIHREVNVGASGGEKKKVELLHMAILKPSFVILDEIDSGVDVDALKTISKFINDYQKESNCSILIITHHTDILKYIHPSYVHILSDGNIIKTGDSSLANIVEQQGFEANEISDNHE